MAGMKIQMTMQPLPGMGAVTTLAEWIERNEILLTSHLLAHEACDDAGNTVCAVFLSRNADGEFLLRLCDGFNDAMMTWREQRRARPMFGRAYAEAIANQWLTQRERMGYRVEWSARRQDHSMPAFNAA